MKEFLANLVLIGAAIAGFSQVFNPQNSEQRVIAQSPAPITVQAPATVTTAAQPRLHKMSLEVSQPEDLKVSVGDAVSAGQIIADQDTERKRLQLQKEQITLSLKRISETMIAQPSAPKTVPELAPILPANYQEQEAAIAKAELQLKQTEASLDLKQRQIDYLRGIQGIDPAILEHESSQLSEIQLKKEVAESELELANGKLASAKQERAKFEYQHQLNVARRVEELNQSQSFYQRQLSEAQEAQRIKDYQLSDLKMKLSSVDDKIAQLAVIRSPYGGQVRRVKFVGQTGNKLNVELSLIVSSGSGTASISPSSSSSPTNPLSPSGTATSTNN
ncbi:MAG: hypothetical protein ACM37W_17890 [Actinomycetota bacterium]